jgi:hypothetical protein
MKIAPLLVQDVVEVARVDPQALREGESGPGGMCSAWR